MFRGPEYAYAALDFTGRGYIFQDDILNSKVMHALPYGIDKEDVKMCFVQNNLFGVYSGGQVSSDGAFNSIPTCTMDFDLFKKTFFNHLYLIQDECQSVADRKAI